MFKSSWSSFSPLERLVSTLVTEIFQSPYCVMQLSVIESSRSLYICSGLVGKISKITLASGFPVPLSPAARGMSWRQYRAVQRCCSELALAPEGWTNLKAPSGSFTSTALTQGPWIPPISVASRKVLPPACNNSSTSQEKSSPASAASTGGGGREKAPGRGEHIWNQLESAECLGKNCRAGRNHSEELRVRTWLWSKGGGRDVYSILKHKTRAPLGALFFFFFFKCKQLNISALSPFHCHWPITGTVRIRYRR